MKIELNGFLEYVSAGDGWEDSIRLCDGDGNRPYEQMVGMPLVLTDAKAFHGKEVTITIETVLPPAGSARPSSADAADPTPE